MLNTLKMGFRVFLALLPISLSIYFGSLIYRNYRYNYITEKVQSEGIKLKGWVYSLDENSSEVTFKMENGEFYTDEYSSDSHSFNLKDTLEFKYSPKYPGEYKYEYEYPKDILIIMNYIIFTFIVFLLSIFFLQVRRVVIIIKSKR